MLLVPLSQISAALNSLPPSPLLQLHQVNNNQQEPTSRIHNSTTSLGDRGLKNSKCSQQPFPLIFLSSSGQRLNRLRSMARNVIPILFTQMFSAYHFCGPLLFMIIVLVFLPMIFILHAQVFLFVALSALIFYICSYLHNYFWELNLLPLLLIVSPPLFIYCPCDLFPSHYFCSLLSSLSLAVTLLLSI
jgi:hypothetical protein